MAWGIVGPRLGISYYIVHSYVSLLLAASLLLYCRQDTGFRNHVYWSLSTRTQTRVKVGAQAGGLGKVRS